MTACLAIPNAMKERAWKKMTSMPHAAKGGGMAVTANDSAANLHAVRGVVQSLLYLLYFPTLRQ